MAIEKANTSSNGTQPQQLSTTNDTVAADNTAKGTEIAQELGFDVVTEGEDQLAVDPNTGERYHLTDLALLEDARRQERERFAAGPSTLTDATDEPGRQVLTVPIDTTAAAWGRGGPSVYARVYKDEFDAEPELAQEAVMDEGLVALDVGGLEPAAQFDRYQELGYIDPSRAFVGMDDDGSFRSIDQGDFEALPEWAQTVVLTDGPDALDMSGLSPEEEFHRLQSYGAIDSMLVFAGIDEEGNFLVDESPLAPPEKAEPGPVSIDMLSADAAHSMGDHPITDDFAPDDFAPADGGEYDDQDEPLYEGISGAALDQILNSALAGESDATAVEAARAELERRELQTALALAYEAVILDPEAAEEDVAIAIEALDQLRKDGAVDSAADRVAAQHAERRARAEAVALPEMAEETGDLIEKAPDSATYLIPQRDELESDASGRETSLRLHHQRDDIPQRDELESEASEHETMLRLQPEEEGASSPRSSPKAIDPGKSTFDPRETASTLVDWLIPDRIDRQLTPDSSATLIYDPQFGTVAIMGDQGELTVPFDFSDAIRTTADWVIPDRIDSQGSREQSVIPIYDPQFGTVAAIHKNTGELELITPKLPEAQFVFLTGQPGTAGFSAGARARAVGTPQADIAGVNTVFNWLDDRLRSVDHQLFPDVTGAPSSSIPVYGFGFGGLQRFDTAPGLTAAHGLQAAATAPEIGLAPPNERAHISKALGPSTPAFALSTQFPFLLQRDLVGLEHDGMAEFSNFLTAASFFLPVLKPAAGIGMSVADDVARQAARAMSGAKSAWKATGDPHRTLRPGPSGRGTVETASITDDIITIVTDKGPITWRIPPQGGAQTADIISPRLDYWLQRAIYDSLVADHATFPTLGNAPKFGLAPTRGLLTTVVTPDVTPTEWPGPVPATPSEPTPTTPTIPDHEPQRPSWPWPGLAPEPDPDVEFHPFRDPATQAETHVRTQTETGTDSGTPARDDPDDSPGGTRTVPNPTTTIPADEPTDDPLDDQTDAPALQPFTVPRVVPKIATSRLQVQKIETLDDPASNPAKKEEPDPRPLPEPTTAKTKTDEAGGQNRARHKRRRVPDSDATSGPRGRIDRRKMIEQQLDSYPEVVAYREPGGLWRTVDIDTGETVVSPDPPAGIPPLAIEGATPHETYTVLSRDGDPPSQRTLDLGGSRVTVGEGLHIQRRRGGQRGRKQRPRRR